MFYVADVAGPAICGLPTYCQLTCNLVGLHCAIGTCSSKVPLPAVKDRGDLQALYPDRFDGIGKFEGEYHIVTDPCVPPVVHFHGSAQYTVRTRNTCIAEPREAQGGRPIKCQG